MYHECPYKWMLRYKKGIKEPPTKALIKGSFVHKVIEEFYALQPRGCGITLNNYKTEFQKYAMDVFDKVLIMGKTYFGKPTPTYAEELRAVCSDDFDYAKEIIDAKNIIRNYIQLFIMQFEQHARNATIFAQVWHTVKPHFNELELKTDDFIGFVDSVVIKDGALCLIDYKSSSLYKFGYSESYERQLHIYAAMYYKLYNEMPKYGVIVFLRFGVQCLYPINEDTIVEEVETLISEFYINTKSDNESDYMRNYDYSFCTCSKSKHKDKSWCFYQDICEEAIKRDGC